jgi:hypothetical protein
VPSARKTPPAAGACAASELLAGAAALELAGVTAGPAELEDVPTTLLSCCPEEAGAEDDETISPPTEDVGGTKSPPPMADDAGTVPCSIPWLNPWLSEDAGITAPSPPRTEPELISGVGAGASPSLLDPGTTPCSGKASCIAEVVSSQFTKAKAHATTMLVNILDFISCLLLFPNLFQGVLKIPNQNSLVYTKSQIKTTIQNVLTISQKQKNHIIRRLFSIKLIATKPYTAITIPKHEGRNKDLILLLFSYFSNPYIRYLFFALVNIGIEQFSWTKNPKKAQ